MNRWSGRPPDPGATTALLFPGAGGQTACDLSLVRATAPDLAERAVVEVGADPFLRAEACDNAPPGGMIRASGLAERRARPLESLVRPIEWRSTLLALHAAGARHFVDVGPSDWMGDLVRRPLPSAQILPALA